MTPHELHHLAEVIAETTETLQSLCEQLDCALAELDRSMPAPGSTIAFACGQVRVGNLSAALASRIDLQIARSAALGKLTPAERELLGLARLDCPLSVLGADETTPPLSVI